MSATTTTTGAVLGAATTAGVLASGITSWQTALAIAALILALGFLFLFLKRKKKNQENAK
ncbi:MAG: LPXTG cell wall anchor domain-containing protein [Candidatus Magasanikiibacteriota bacterium]